MPAPLASAPLPLGAIRACGSLLEQLRLAAHGLAGHMTDVWPDVGATSGWVGGPGEHRERGPSYARGLRRLPASPSKTGVAVNGAPVAVPAGSVAR